MTSRSLYLARELKYNTIHLLIGLIANLLIRQLFHLLPPAIHDKDVVAILHLLVALAHHFECPRKLPGGVTINMVVVQKKGGILLPMKVVEELTAANEGEE